MFGPSSSATAGIGEPLQNSMVFAFGFFEIAIWFWVSQPISCGEVVRLTVNRSSPVSVKSETH